MNESSAIRQPPWQEGPVLGIESSCDETAAAVVGCDGSVLSSIVSSQHEVHKRFGGVVPELASRAHVETIEPVVMAALAEAGLSWKELAGIAVTCGPGLAGALIVGVSYAKTLAYGLEIPIVGISHLEGHIESAWLQDPSFPLPCVVMIVSGGHTHLYLRRADRSCIFLGSTRDDAAGEAFDKGAQMLGLGFPGGPALDRLAQKGDPRCFKFPSASFKHGKLEFSFSGLKTSLLYKLQDMDEESVARHKADLAAGYQEAIVTDLVRKGLQAVKQTGVKNLAVVGGVSANSRLRTILQEKTETLGIRLSIPPLRYCTDNAAMIAAAGVEALRAGYIFGLDAESTPRLEPILFQRDRSWHVVPLEKESSYS